MRLEIIAAAALIDNADRIVLTQRPQGKPLAGLWEFPGGKLEAGETPPTALMRELHEELGIGILPASATPLGFFSRTQGQRHLLFLLFLCRSWRGALRPCEKQALQWVPRRELGLWAMPPGNAPLVRALQALPWPSQHALAPFAH